jgi:DNA-directed RNA polymerase specialized sigma24 family protein
MGRGSSSSHHRRIARGGRPDLAVSQAVTAARRGDRDAIGYLYCRYGDRVYAEVLSVIVDPHEAQHLTQELFAKLGATLPPEDEPRVPFPAWVMLLAGNMARARVASRRAWAERHATRGGHPSLPSRARS